MSLTVEELSRPYAGASVEMLRCIDEEDAIVKMPRGPERTARLVAFGPRFERALQAVRLEELVRSVVSSGGSGGGFGVNPIGSTVTQGSNGSGGWFPPNNAVGSNMPREVSDADGRWFCGVCGMRGSGAADSHHCPPIGPGLKMRDHF
jgi:hypothetical protein